jgi:hypothetical protein
MGQGETEALSYNVDDDMDLDRYDYLNKGTWKGYLKYTLALLKRIQPFGTLNTCEPMR